MKVFNRILIAITIVVAISSCATKKRCFEKFELKTDTVFVEKRIDSILIKDKIILKKDTVSKTDTLPCPELNYYNESKSGNLIQIIDIKKGVITATCLEDSLKRANDTLKITINNLIREKQSIESEKIKEISKFNSFLIVCGWLFWILLLIIIVSILIKFKK
jgi:hypothetical protein